MAGSTELRRLWAPWRMTYIQGAEAAAPARGRTPRERRGGAPRKASVTADCLFCRIRARRSDRSDLVLARRPHAFLMLNRFPYNPAHVMVAVTRHAARFAELALEEQRDLIELTALAERALEAEYRPHGVNYGANVGRIAGAGYPGHLHLHLVPRWNGDTNFMPTIAETKVLPESLSRTWARLRKAVGLLEAGAARSARPARSRRA